MFYLVIILFSTVALSLAANRLPQEKRYQILRYACISNYIFLYFYKGMLWLAPDFDFNIWLDLPLALCNVTSLLIIFGVIYRNQLLLSFSFIFGTGAALTALVTPLDEFVNMGFFSVETLYYIYHGVLLCLAVMVLTTGLYRPRLRHLLQATALMLALCIVIHGVNLLLIATVEPEANYFFTFGLSGNPLSDWARSVIDMDIFMILPLISPWVVLMVPLFLWYNHRYPQTYAVDG